MTQSKPEAIRRCLYYKRHALNHLIDTINSLQAFTEGSLHLWPHKPVSEYTQMLDTLRRIKAQMYEESTK